MMMPGPRHSPHCPLFPEPPGSAGARLCAVVGLGQDEYLARFTRVNLFHTYRTWTGRRGGVRTWDAAAARLEAQRLWPLLVGRPVVLLGSKVAEAFSPEVASAPPMSFVQLPGSEVLGVGDLWVCRVPHTSGLSRAWNDPRVARDAGALLRMLARGIVVMLGPAPVYHRLEAGSLADIEAELSPGDVVSPPTQGRGRLDGPGPARPVGSLLRDGGPHPARLQPRRHRRDGLARGPEPVARPRRVRGSALQRVAERLELVLQRGVPDLRAAGLGVQGRYHRLERGEAGRGSRGGLLPRVEGDDQPHVCPGDVRPHLHPAGRPGSHDLPLPARGHSQRRELDLPPSHSGNNTVDSYDPHVVLLFGMSIYYPTRLAVSRDR